MMRATNHLAIAAIVGSSMTLSACSADLIPPVKNPPPASWNFIQMVDSDADATSYSYGPSIIRKDGVYHVFFCSAGAYPTWDSIRYVHSTDGKNWSTPTIMLRSTGTNGFDLAACDPSVVYYHGFYYMYYSSSYTTAPNFFQTVIQVARSTMIDGPYLTYTQRWTWEDTPTDPQIIVKPLVTRSQDPTGYGAGQQTVLVHNNEILMWYTDDSIDPNAGLRTFMLRSIDPVTWTPSSTAEINVQEAHSIDVKYDAAKNQYVMTRIINPHKVNSYLTRSLSSDGLSWGPFTTIINAGTFPDYANNVGAAGDETGNMLPSPFPVAFGAPYDLNGFDNWGQWDLYGVLVNGPQSLP